jgi:hypothetical protein
MRTHRTVVALLAVAGALLALVALTRRPDTHPAAPTPQPPAGPVPAAAASAARTLGALTVLPHRPHVGGYQRGCAPGQACSFGPAWTDDTTAPGGHNGCDTRNDVLAAQLADIVHRTGSRCVIVAGELHDPYTGQTIRFTKQHATAVQIDHLVPLALAWDLGAGHWTQARREAYANDEQLVLLAVSGPANEAKGDSGPGEWMPPNRTDWCTYADRYITVLAHYQLPVTTADKTALTYALTTCPSGSRR